jgi:hypothetical protein
VDEPNARVKLWNFVCKWSCTVQETEDVQMQVHLMCREWKNLRSGNGGEPN